MRASADDTMIYRPIRSQEDVEILQEDLDRVYRWSQDWLLKFNALKCEHLRISTSKKQLAQGPKFQLAGSVIPSSDRVKYLGVTLSQDLKWKKHWKEVCSKSNQLLGMLRRNLHGASAKAKRVAYTSLVRSRLEYASVVTDPYTKGDEKFVEMAQRRDVRFICSNYNYTDSSVTEMRKSLELDELKDRRKVDRL
jgi:hypothetical protein